MSRNELDRVIDVLKTERDNIDKTLIRLEAARTAAKKTRRTRTTPRRSIAGVTDHRSANEGNA